MKMSCPSSVWFLNKIAWICSWLCETVLELVLDWSKFRNPFENWYNHGSNRRKKKNYSQTCEQAIGRGRRDLARYIEHPHVAS